jgi:hypothetical protein
VFFTTVRFLFPEQTTTMSTDPLAQLIQESNIPTEPFSLDCKWFFFSFFTARRNFLCSVYVSVDFDESIFDVPDLTTPAHDPFLSSTAVTTSSDASPDIFATTATSAAPTPPSTTDATTSPPQTPG